MPAHGYSLGFHDVPLGSNRPVLVIAKAIPQMALAVANASQSYYEFASSVTSCAVAKVFFGTRTVDCDRSRVAASDVRVQFHLDGQFNFADLLEEGAASSLPQTSKGYCQRPSNIQKRPICNFPELMGSCVVCVPFDLCKHADLGDQGHRSGFLSRKADMNSMGCESTNPSFRIFSLSNSSTSAPSTGSGHQSAARRGDASPARALLQGGPKNKRRPFCLLRFV
jgi:hypothetical protein